MSLGQEVLSDYATTGLSLKRHPIALVRPELARLGIRRAKDVVSLGHGSRVSVCGLVLIRQRPGTASGIVFITLEDETGIVNLIVRPKLYERFRSAARHSAVLQCDGTLERRGDIVHVMARRLIDRSQILAGLDISSRDFH
jgi:error-prone DNA polymerase